MSKIFSLIFVFLLAFPMTACGQSEVGETGAAGDTETIPAADTTPSYIAGSPELNIIATFFRFRGFLG